MLALLACTALLPSPSVAHFFESHDKKTVAQGHPVENIAGRMQGVISDEFISTSPPTPQCHAGTLAEAPGGAIVAAWFGGKHERAADVGIWAARLEPGAKAWGAPVEVANGMHMGPRGRRQPAWNPVLFQVPEDGPMLLFYKIGATPRVWRGYLKMSTDGGLTWGKQIALPSNVYGPSKNKPVLLKDGTLLVPSSDEATWWSAHLETTADLTTWSRSAPLNKKNIKAIQPTLLVGGKNGRAITLLARTEDQGVVKALSTDGGFSFTPMVSAGLPNPNSGLDAVTLSDGRRHLLVYNHAVKRNRFPLNLAMSEDMGATWRALGVLEHGDHGRGEFSYPAIIQASDGRVHILYTWHRLRMRHVVVDPDKMSMGKLIVSGHWPPSVN